ncbi:ribosome-associated protein [Lachnospiraceae bacterium KH1T2]|nr:ribosome-associated protein [Lachnospiraceae bacterium KH1T2]
MKTTEELLKVAVDALEDKKGEDVSVLDIRKVTVISDYFIIATGNNPSQVQAMADNVEEALGREGLEKKSTEGYEAANWILLDYGDFIIHIFDRDNRSFYDIERIWKDADKVEI